MKNLMAKFSLRMRTGIHLLALLAILGSGISVHAADLSAANDNERSSRFVFSLLPKSLQQRPSLDFHVITELSADGRKLAPASADKPIYYIAQPGEFTQMGTNVPGGERRPDLGQLTRAMEAALASSHHLKASPSTPLPAIAVVFNYGSFARFSMAAYDQEEEQNLSQLAFQMEEAQRINPRAVGPSNVDSAMIDRGPMLRSEDRDTDALLPIVLAHTMERDEVLRRATLIGGERFARDFAKALADEVKSRTGAPDPMLGFAGLASASPFHRFMDQNENLTMLVEDSFNGCYFVIASAFDYRAMREGQRVLLWRTKMTVNSSGISMSESLPQLVHTAGPYLGREMADAVTLRRRISRDGKVEAGELRVIETDVPLRDSAESTSPTRSPDGSAKKP